MRRGSSACPSLNWRAPHIVTLIWYQVAEVVGDIVADEANIIFGTSVDETLGEVAVTVVATASARERLLLHEGRTTAATIAWALHDRRRRLAALRYMIVT